MNSRYELLEIIAEGGLGSVYRGWDSNLSREVAVKRLRIASNEDAAARTEELLREARLLSALQHPNIVTVYDVGQDDEGAYLVMELVKGETLEDIIDRGALNEADFEQLVVQSLEGLIAAHSLDLVHLDLKPQNVMICWHPSGRFQVKILDFGLAQISPSPCEQVTDKAGAVMGSVFFMAPEQFERQPVDQRTDLYALGCIFYHALTQQYPFQGETGQQVMVAHLKHWVIPLAKFRPDLSEFVIRWVEWMMSLRSTDRPENASQAVRAFRSKQFPPKPAKPVAVVSAIPAVAIPKAQPAPLPVATAIAVTEDVPHYLPPRPRPVKKGIPKWSLVTLPLLGVLILGYGALRLVQSANEAGRQERFANLVAAEKPLGTDVDVRLLLTYLESPKSSPAAAQTLSKIGGGDYIDPILLDHLDQAKSREAKGNLAKVLGMRGVVAAVPKLSKMLDATQADVRKAAWTALGMLSRLQDFPLLFKRLASTPPDEMPFAEAALASAATNGNQESEKTTAVVGEFQTGLGGDGYRSALLRIMGGIGSPQVFGVIQSTLSQQSPELRKNACLALAQWPSTEAVPPLADRFLVESDPAIRLILLSVLGNLVTQRGPLSQEELFRKLRPVHEAAKDTREKTEAFSLVSRVVAPGVVTFCQEMIAQDSPKAAEFAAVQKRVELALEKVISVEGETVLAVDTADFAKAGGLRLVDGALVNWLSESDWVSWLVEFKEIGKYEISISQASASDEDGKYEILVAGVRLETAVVNTGGQDRYQSFVNGKIQISSPGIHKVWLQPTLMPRDDVLFRLKNLGIKKAAD